MCVEEFAELGLDLFWVELGEGGLEFWRYQKSCICLGCILGVKEV
jgi:hypothetical protein